ncbi:radical SAM protein [Kamptonema sp. UHCC 0994]|uniref:radical SAM protein n=1 Tax=Kamptonema sp. UHCC 0994 TaxID=3031329 RepID=UPI0023B9E4DA|nr:radical SAM protein [Kamptonema sp. UHCC 0994]MDF0552273.1 radical SAM protein [Kamptonema sp. UHCC 0994]
MSSTTTSKFSSVYGPVKSWRYGRSLGIDPIGPVSTCSFNCVYCQLGEIEVKISDRAIFIPTKQILEDLQSFAPWDVDSITLSGSGEPTQALNLGEIIASVKKCTNRAIAVLTNGTLLTDPQVRSELALADKVSVKLDAVSSDRLQRINRPVAGIDLQSIQTGLQQFRQQYNGEFGIQTMVLSPWDAITKTEYIRLMKSLAPAEIQLNTPTRPKPLTRQLDGRGNHTAEDRPYPVQILKCVSSSELEAIANQIQKETNIPVRFAPHTL